MTRPRRTHTARGHLGLESLERRQLLAADAWSTPARVATPVAMPAAMIAPTASPAIPVSVVTEIDPLYGYSFALATPDAAQGFDFTTLGRRMAASIDVGLVDLPLGTTLDLEVLSGLRFWDGRGVPAFAAAKGGVELNLRAAGADLRVSATTDQLARQAPGSVRHALAVAVSDGLPASRRIAATIGVGGAGESFAKPTAPSGIYAFTGLWSVRNARGIRDSIPITLVFAAGTVSRQARDAAVAAFSAPAGRPAAIVAVASQVVTPDGPGQPFLRIDVQYSAPVTVTGRSPQLPVFFDRTMRLAELDRGSARAGVTTLSFVLVPTAQERAAASLRLGPALRLQSGGTLRAAAGGTAILSLPPDAGRDRVVGFEIPVAIVTADIARSTTFRRGTTYVIDGEVHVRAGATLTIEDGVTVLIRNGRRPRRTIDASALVFDSGSALKATTVTFAAADSQNRPTMLADNGGVFFLGTTRSCSKDGISVNTATASGRSSFTANLINLVSLGRTDSLGRSGDAAQQDDIDAVSLLGLGQTEWRVKAVRIENSGDDGFDVTSSSVALERLTVINPVEDGLNVTSSTVQIRLALTVAMSPSIAPDRELFDLEVNAGPAKVVIDRLAAVDLRGYWGNAYDEVNLNSLDMPAPPRRGAASQWYVFTGVLTRGPAIVYSTIAD